MPTSKGNPAESAFRYPWTMAPTMNMTKPVTTAIATFVSIDKFIIFPFNLWRQPPVAPFFGFCFSYIASDFGVLMVVLKAKN